MAGIQEYLELIKNAVYGREVRQAIHDAIHECYEDGKAGTIDLVAREQIAELIAPSGEAPSAAEVTDARIDADGVTHTSLGESVRSQVTGLKDAFDFNLFASKFVKYNSFAPYSFNANATRPYFRREGNEFELNGTAVNTCYIKLSEEGSTNYATSNSAAQAFPKNVTLEDGHIYKLKFVQYAGSYTSTAFTIRMYSSSDYITVNKDVEKIVVGSGEMRNAVVLCASGSVFNNAKFEFTIEDITEDALNTNSKYLVGAINENNAMVKPCLTGYFADATEIPANSDLNDYTTAGNYRIISDEIGNTVLNLPTNQRRGRLFVMQPYASARYMQIFFSGSNGSIYTRRYTNQWYPWKMVYQDTLSELNSSSDMPVNSNAVIDAINGMMPSLGSAANTMKLGYSWWVNNRAVDSYGNLYFGYISENSMCGVGCRFPDGSIARHDLYASEENDDHNAPSVIIVTKDEQEYVCVIGSTGHNTDNKMHCYLASSPNTIDTKFANKTVQVTPPTGYQYQNTYSQAFFDTYTDDGVTYNRITNFFRIRQRVAGQSHPYHMVWVCAVSDDYGDTWKFYSVFAVAEEDTLFYMASANTNNPWIKRVVLQPNTALINYKPLSTGFINLAGNKVLDGDGVQIGELLEFNSTRLAYDEDTTPYNLFTIVVNNETDCQYRILDVWNIDTDDLTFLFCKSEPLDTEVTQPHRFVNDWTLYRYKNGTVLEVGHLGGAFFKASGYVTGACFYNDTDHVIYSQNNSKTITVTVDGKTKQRQLQDGQHSLHVVEISNDTVASDEIIKTSMQTIARPLRYDKGSVMMLNGQYREGKGTAFLTWHFGIQFIDRF